jgi:hypothetical protein
MKQIYLLLFLLILGNQLTLAQDSNKMEIFLGKILAAYSPYFDKAEFTENGQLSLSALDKYFMLTIDKKTEILEDINANWQEALVIIHGATQNELWGRNSQNGKANLIDQWGMAPTPPTTTITEEPQRFLKHPWFFYIGEQGMMDTNHNINFALNTRVGFFLLLNKWDLAATYSLNLMGSEGSDDFTGQTNAGLMSKVYFPMKKWNISPNVGGGISWNSSMNAQNESTQSINKSILLGVSWFVGFGSLDVGIQSGKEVTSMIGFTFFPNLMSKKK